MAFNNNKKIMYILFSFTCWFFVGFFSLILNLKKKKLKLIKNPDDITDNGLVNNKPFPLRNKMTDVNLEIITLESSSSNQKQSPGDSSKEPFHG